MAQAAWNRPGAPIGKKSPPQSASQIQGSSSRTLYPQEVRELKTLAKGNTPTGVISLKLGRPRPLSVARLSGRVFRLGLSTARRTIDASAPAEGQDRQIDWAQRIGCQQSAEPPKPPQHARRSKKCPFAKTLTARGALKTTSN
jgi:hypothetical protein